MTTDADAGGGGPTLYERLGGKDAIGLVADMILASAYEDPLLKPYFAKIPDKKRHQRQLTRALAGVLGGPPGYYHGPGLREAHARLDPPLGDEHFDALMRHAAQALRDAGVGGEDAACVAFEVELLRGQVTGPVTGFSALPGSQRRSEPLPGGGGERQDRAVRVLGVPDQDRPGRLHAAAVGQAAAGPAPLQALAVAHAAAGLHPSRTDLGAVRAVGVAGCPPAGPGHDAPNLSNSPFRAPPMKQAHSCGVNLSTAPPGSLLSRTPTAPPGRSATSTQPPLEKLRELLTQAAPEPPGDRAGTGMAAPFEFWF